MKNVLTGLVVTVVVLIVYWFFSKKKDSDSSRGADDPIDESFCVAINRAKFKVKWQFKKDGKDNVPSGTTGRLADKFFDGKPGYAGKIGGFFKGIDTFPSEATARYYEKEMLQWVSSDYAYDWWHMVPGELICNKESTSFEIPKIDINGY